MSQQPYIIRVITTEIREYNPEYGDERICECGHTYYRHFDSYEEMEACGCKYCYCDHFVEIEEDRDTIEDAGTKGYEDGKTGLPYVNPYEKCGDDERWHEEYKMKYQWGVETRRDLGND